MAVSAVKSFSAKASPSATMFSSTGDFFVMCTDEGAVIITPRCDARDATSGVSFSLEVIDPPPDEARLDLTGGTDFETLHNKLQTKRGDEYFELLLNPDVTPTSKEDEPQRAYCAAAISPSTHTLHRYAVATLAQKLQLCIHMKALTVEKWMQVVDVSELWCAQMRESDYELIARPVEERVRAGVDPQLARLTAAAGLQAASALCMSHRLSPKDNPDEQDIELCLLATGYLSGHVALWKVLVPPTNNDSVFLLSVVKMSGVGGITVLHWCRVTSLSGLVAVGLQTGEVACLLVTWDGVSAQVRTSRHTLFDEKDKLVPKVCTWLQEEEVLLVGKGPYVMALRLRVDVAAAVVGVAASGLLLLGSSLPVSGLSNRCGFVVGCTAENRTAMISVSNQDDTVEMSVADLHIELPGQTPWRCHGVALSQNAVFVATVHSPREMFCHLSVKQPLKMSYTSVRDSDEVLDLLLGRNDLVGMTDALVYVQQSYVDTGALPERLQALIEPTAFNDLSSAHLKLARFLIQLKVTHFQGAEEQLEELRRHLVDVETLIMRRHARRGIEAALQLKHRHQLSATERTSAQLLIGRLEAPGDGAADAVRLAERARVELGLTTDEAPVCAVCGLHYEDLSSLFDVGCPNGHRFGRCCQTLLACAEPRHRTCVRCGASSRHPRATPDDSEWLRTLLENYCCLCDGDLT